MKKEQYSQTSTMFNRYLFASITIQITHGAFSEEIKREVTYSITLSVFKYITRFRVVIEKILFRNRFLSLISNNFGVVTHALALFIVGMIHE